MVHQRLSLVYLSCYMRDVLWRLNEHYDHNFEALVLLRRQSEGGKNNFITEDASSSAKGSRGVAKCYRKGGRQSA
jgi:hypothetical protein